MIKAIAKSNLGIILKNLSLAAVLVLGLSQTARANESEKYQDLRIACDPAINQDSKLNCSFNELLGESDRVETVEVAQGRRGRRRKSKVQGYYGGFSLGAMFPSGEVDLNTDILSNLPEVDFNTGFAGSVFGGIKFSKNIAAELEFLAGFGSGDSDDFDEEIRTRVAGLREIAGNAPGAFNVNGDFESSEIDYSAFALYASPRFDLPISNRLSVYISPGIGLSQTNVNYEADGDLSVSLATPSGNAEADASFNATADEFNELTDDTDRDSSQTGISFRIKAGAEFQISNSIEIFGQVQYVTLPTESNDQFDVDNLNSFLTQAGLTFNF